MRDAGLGTRHSVASPVLLPTKLLGRLTASGKPVLSVTYPVELASLTFSAGVRSSSAALLDNR